MEFCLHKFLQSLLPIKPPEKCANAFFISWSKPRKKLINILIAWNLSSLPIFLRLRKCPVILCHSWGLFTVSASKFSAWKLRISTLIATSLSTILPIKKPWLNVLLKISDLKIRISVRKLFKVLYRARKMPVSCRKNMRLPPVTLSKKISLKSSLNMKNSRLPLLLLILTISY